MILSIGDFKRNTLKQVVLTSIILILFLFPRTSFTQDKIFDDKKHKIGFIAGYGNQEGTKIIGKNYVYKVTLLQFQYSIAFKRKQSFSVEFLLQPQFNFTKYKEVFSDVGLRNGYEYGVNIGFLIRKNFLEDKLSIYGLISAGPHFVSGTPERQADGFIFSDNLFLGLSVKLYNNLYFDFRPGYRHLSNAKIKQPNGGVNSIVLSAGFFVVL